MNFYDFFIQPFLNYGFMKRALLGCIGLSIAGGPIGILLILRRMSLLGEALSHGILPGIALSNLLFGLWIPGFVIGSMLAGFLITTISRLIHLRSTLCEDATFSGIYLLSLAIGILMLSIGQGNFNVMHLLFGDVLAVDRASIIFIGIICSFVVVFLAFTYRTIVYDCFDPIYMKVIQAKQGAYHALFWALVVMLLVAASITIGTLMSLGLLIIPALTSRLLTQNLMAMFYWSTSLGIISSYLGLICSYHLNWPSGPTIVLCAGIIFLLTFFLKQYYGTSKFF